MANVEAIEIMAVRITAPEKWSGGVSLIELIEFLNKKIRLDECPKGDSDGQ